MTSDQAVWCSSMTQSAATYAAPKHSGWETLRKPSIQVIGAGHVGLVFALHQTQRGHAVDLVDHPGRISSLAHGDPEMHEPGVSAALHHALACGLLNFHECPQPALGGITFICVGDSRHRGQIRAETVVSLVEQHCDVLNAGVVCVRSTVPVGTTRRVAAMLPGAVVLSTPEFLREGHALADLADDPEVIIGTDSEAAVPDRVVHLLAPHDRGASVCSWEAAETTKILRNALNAVRVAFINEVEMAVSVPERDADFVARHLVDCRGLGRYGRAGLPPGGSCLPAAVEYLTTCARVNGRHAPILESYRASSELRLQGIVDDIAASGTKRILVLGLSYRPNTDDIHGSWAFRLAEALAERGKTVCAHDPYVAEPPPHVTMTNLTDGFAWADHIVLAVAHPAFSELSVPESVTWTDLTGGQFAPERVPGTVSGGVT